MDEPVQQRATVVTEGRAAVCVNLELMFASGVLGKDSKQTERRGNFELRCYTTRVKFKIK